MANKHLKLESHKVKPGCWWYEESKGISVIVEHRSRDGNTYHHTEHYLIPWRQIRVALARKDK